MELITADKQTYSAFADMIDDYAVAGTPFYALQTHLYSPILYGLV